MTEEEKKAIKIVKGLAVYYDDYSLLDEEEIKENESVNKSIELILNLIEKLQRENEELKNQEETARKVNELLVERYSTSIPVKKIKDKIEELIKEGRHYNANKIEVLQELLEGEE